jgi:hypothetical protein
MKHAIIILILISIPFIILSQSGNNIKLYVSTTGSDQAAGSVENPLGTLQKAVEVAREKRQPGRDCSITILIREGKYYLDKPLILTFKDSGTESSPFIISAFPGEKVIISGGLRLQLSWNLYRDGIFMAQTEKTLTFDQLFINGQKQILARYPNYDPLVPVWNGYAADADSPERLTSYRNPAGAFIHRMHAGLWGSHHFVVKSVTADGQLILEGGFQNNRNNYGYHPEFKFIENVLEELDSTGEWFYAPEAGIIYYKPPEGMNLQKSITEIPLLESCITIKGSMGNPVHDVIIRELIFQHTLRTFMKTSEPLLRSDWTIYRQGMVFIEGAERITLQECVFDSPGGNALFLSNYNRFIDIRGNYIHDAGAGGINIVGNTDAARSPLFEYGQSNSPEEIDTLTGPKNQDYPSDCKISDNLICSTGRIEKQTAGINLAMASDICISHNTIFNVPRAGINICTGTWGGHIIEYNDVFSTVLETGDHGAFNSWGRERYWFPNRQRMDSMAAASPRLIIADAIRTTILRNNRMRCDRGWDIDLDDGSSNYLIENNLCLNGGIKLREGFFRAVKNNIMINNSFHPHAWFMNSGDIFKHNIVFSAYKSFFIPDWGNEVDSNLFATQYALSKARQNGTDEHSLSGDPLFIDPIHADFRVENNSPALQIGFENFDIDNFGVQNTKLKALALKPDMPSLSILTIEEESDQPIDWRGARIKKLKGTNEMSATGMTGETGILIVELKASSPLFQNGLQAKDVILKVNGKNINSLQDFFYYYEEESWVHSVKLSVYRDQQEIEVELGK